MSARTPPSVVERSRQLTQLGCYNDEDAVWVRSERMGSFDEAACLARSGFGPFGGK